MKKISILLFAIIMSTSLFAQDENKSQDEVKSLFGGAEITHGGYGGIAINYTQIDGQDAILVGVKGGWIINHGITIGLAGYGFANDVSYEKTINGNPDNYTLAGGYGGLLIEPILWGLKPVHISIPILIGAGGAAFWHFGMREDPSVAHENFRREILGPVHAQHYNEFWACAGWVMPLE